MELKMDEELTKKFQAVKEHTGMNSDKSVIGFLIAKEYERIQKAKTKVIPIEPDVYESLKICAKTLGYPSVDAYAEKILLNIMKQQEQKVQA